MFLDKLFYFMTTVDLFTHLVTPTDLQIALQENC